MNHNNIYRYNLKYVSVVLKLTSRPDFGFYRNFSEYHCFVRRFNVFNDSNPVPKLLQI